MADAPVASAPPDAGEGFKKPRARGNMRKRPAIEDDPGAPTEEAGPSVIRAEKAAKPTPFVQSTKDRTQARAEDVGAQASDRRISAYDNKVFATNEQETTRDRDAQSIFERQKLLEGDEPTTANGDKVYRGANNYRSFTKRSEDFDSAVASGQGPQRAPIHYRAVCRFDYQPDICKDYKETGFCGYGDACKFMHDRGDYKTGVQLDREFDAKEKERQRRLDQGLPAEDPAEGVEAPPPGDDLPFACLLCRTPWAPKSDPVVTKCGHHFCETCACAHFAKSKRCFVCNELTHGTFNAAKKLREQIKANANVAVGSKEWGGEDDDDEVVRYEAQGDSSKRARILSAGAWGY
ncbi:hypothetical protein T492DRAFT_600007 [Pavlovales sp. CCMP2436]|nr:hypothetical protein T492DRAFT_600007 [Pavlovales sp. CCMP2436]